MKRKLALTLTILLTILSIFTFGVPKIARASSCMNTEVAYGMSQTVIPWATSSTISLYLIGYKSEVSGCPHYSQYFFYERWATTNGILMTADPQYGSAYGYITAREPIGFNQYGGLWNGYSGCTINNIGVQICTSGQFSTPWINDAVYSPDAFSNYILGRTNDPSQVESGFEPYPHMNLIETATNPT